jgi:hypothetical protein
VSKPGKRPKPNPVVIPQPDESHKVFKEAMIQTMTVPEKKQEVKIIIKEVPVQALSS